MPSNKYTTTIALCLSALALFPTAKVFAIQADSIEQTITRKVRAYFTAMGKGELATIQQSLAEDYIVIGGDGKLETRAERLAWLRSNTKNLVAITPTELRVRVYTRSAVVTGLAVIPADASGPAIEERFTQLWVQRDDVWKMVSGQITIVRK